MNESSLLTTSSSSILPLDTYIYQLHPIQEFRHLAVISSDDSLRFLDPTTLQAVSPKSLRHEGVTGLNGFAADPHCVLTAGRDATIRCWDTRSGKLVFELNGGVYRGLFIPVANCLSAEGINGPGSTVAYLSLDSHGSYVAAGAELKNAEAAVTTWSVVLFPGNFLPIKRLKSLTDH